MNQAATAPQPLPRGADRVGWGLKHAESEVQIGVQIAGDLHASGRIGQTSPVVRYDHQDVGAARRILRRSRRQQARVRSLIKGVDCTNTAGQTPGRRAVRHVPRGDRWLPRPGAQGWPKTGPSPVDRRKQGSKHHIITDAGGSPLAVSLTGGNRHDVTQLMEVPELLAEDVRDFFLTHTK